MTLFEGFSIDTQEDLEACLEGMFRRVSPLDLSAYPRFYLLWVVVGSERLGRAVENTAEDYPDSAEALRVMFGYLTTGEVPNEWDRLRNHYPSSLYRKKVQEALRAKEAEYW